MLRSWPATLSIASQSCCLASSFTDLPWISLDIINATWLTQQLSVKFLDQLDEIEAEATESMGIRAAAEVVEAALERASYSTAEHRSLKARYG